MSDRPASLRGASSPWTLAAGELETLRAGLRLQALRSLGDADAADDVAQETLARTHCAIENGQVNDPANVAAFARGVARHVIADILRARGRVEPLECQPEEATVAKGMDFLELAVTEEEHRRVRAVLGTLARADAELLRLSFFEGLTPLEVAARTGEPAERIRKRKSRALERLRHAFFGSEPGHDAESTATDEERIAPEPSRTPRHS